MIKWCIELFMNKTRTKRYSGKWDDTTDFVKMFKNSKRPLKIVKFGGIVPNIP